MEIYTLTCETYNDGDMTPTTQTTVYCSREDAVTAMKAYIKATENSYRAEYEDVEIEFNSGDGWEADYEILDTDLNIISMFVYPKGRYYWEHTFYLKKHEI